MYLYEELFYKSSTPKKLILEFDNGEIIENERIFAESMVIHESICSAERLTFGSTESNSFSVKISDIFISHKNLWFNAYIVLNNNDETKMQLGRYYVVDDVATGDHSKRDIKAYDFIYKMREIDVSEWYKSLEFPMTLKEFRTSFTQYLGITEKNIVLVNDNIVLEKTIEPEKIVATDILTSYCELNGCFPNIARDGELEYIILPTKGDLGKLYPDDKLYPSDTLIPIGELYPNNNLYPSDNLYPINASNTKRLSKSSYSRCTYDEFETKPITKLQIREQENDIGAISGTGDNCYIIEDNFLVYGKDAEELKLVADNLFGLISKTATYIPFSAECIGNPCIPVGQAVQLITRYEIINSFVLTRTLHGIQSLKDTYSATGVEYYGEIVNDVNTSIMQLKGKSNVLIRTVEKTISTITDLAKNLQTQISQTSEAIKLKVTKGEVSSEISQESGKIKIKANRFSLESDNCTIAEDGTITATNCDLSGQMTTTNSDNIYTKIVGGVIEFGKGAVKSGTIKTLENDSKDAIGIYIDTNYQLYINTNTQFFSKPFVGGLGFVVTDTELTNTLNTTLTNYIKTLDADQKYQTKINGANGSISFTDANGMSHQISVSNGIITNIF